MHAKKDQVIQIEQQMKRHEPEESLANSRIRESGWYRARVGIIRRKSETLEGQSLSDPIDHNSKFRYFSSSASEMGRHRNILKQRRKKI